MSDLASCSPGSTARWSKPPKSISYENQPKGPNARNLCNHCGQEVPEGRNHLCSTECQQAWKLRTNPQYVRLKILQRDRGICAKCGVDTLKDQRVRRARATGHLWQVDHVVPVAEGGGECGLDNLRTLCAACHKDETAALRQRLASKPSK